jgi:hypothetical protein
MKEKVKDYLIIDRSKWINANHGNGFTELLNNEGFSCCLGFRCNQMGVPKKDLLGISTPEILAEDNDWINIPDLVHLFGGIVQETPFTLEAIDINDNNELGLLKREIDLIKLFKEKDIIVKFKGKYRKSCLTKDYVIKEEEMKLINLYK